LLRGSNSILISGDREEVPNERRAGIWAYYLLEEYNNLITELQRL